MEKGHGIRQRGIEVCVSGIIRNLFMIMHNYTSELAKNITPLLKSYGFNKRGLNWFTENVTIAKIFNIQKSQWGKQIYINIGIFIKILGSNTPYTHSKYHIQTRLDSLIEKNILDFENDIALTTRIDVFNKILIKNPYGFFTLQGSMDDVRKFINASNPLIFKEARQLLKIES